MMGKEVLLIAKCFSFSSLFSLHQKFIHLSFLSNVSIFKNIPMIVMATISTAIPPSWMELGDFSSRYSTNREREREIFVRFLRRTNIVPRVRPC